MKGVKIAGIGIALPRRVLTNEDLARILLERRDNLLKSGVKMTPEQMAEYETSDEWILSRVGVRERRIAEDHECTSDYAARAAAEAWTDAYGDGLEIPDFLYMATVSPDYFTTPPTNVAAHRKLAIPVFSKLSGKPIMRNFKGRDITQACTSFLVALDDADSLIRSGKAERGWVVGADLMFRVISRNRRSPFVILGDAGGSFAVEATVEEKSWFGPRAFFSGVDGGPGGEFERMIINRAGGSAVPIKPEHLDPLVDAHLMMMDGRAVYENIVPRVANEIMPGALVNAGLSWFDIEVLILHQANLRMTEAIIKRIVKANEGLAVAMVSRDYTALELIVKEWILPRGMKDQTEAKHIIICYNNIERFGNPTSASIPLSVYEACELGIIVPSKRVMLAAYGGGFSWCSVIIEWGGRDLPQFQKK
ncbi:MAG: ketoacyl-ACP synthase III [Patescibacteria group bacterium]